MSMSRREWRRGEPGSREGARACRWLFDRESRLREGRPARESVARLRMELWDRSPLDCCPPG